MVMAAKIFSQATSTQSYLFFGPMKIDDVHVVADLADIVIEHSSLGVPGNRFADVNRDGLADLSFSRSDGNDYIVTLVYGGARRGSSLELPHRGQGIGMPALGARFSTPKAMAQTRAPFAFLNRR